MERRHNCEHCGSSDLIQTESGMCCRVCGVMSSQPIFTWSYGQSVAPLQQRAIYNRTKRFTEFIRSLKFPEFRGRLNDILDLYNTIEFHFAMRVKNKERKYFYSRKVVLFYIAARLGIDVEVPLLKDNNRNEEQLTSIQNLRQFTIPGREF